MRDGSVFWAGRWRTPEGIERRREQQRSMQSRLRKEIRRNDRANEEDQRRLDASTQAEV